MGSLDILSIVHQVEMDIGGDLLDWHPRIISGIVRLPESPAMCQIVGNERCSFRHDAQNVDEN